MDNTNYLEKADFLFKKATKKFKKLNSFIYKYILPYSYSIKLAHEIIDLLRSAAKNYKIINSQRYIKALLHKARVEKIFLCIQYIYTILELADYLSNGTYFDKLQSIEYYNMALQYCLETKIDEVYNIYNKMLVVYKSINCDYDMVILSEKMVDEYSNLITNYNIVHIYKFLAFYYYSTGEYIKSQLMYDQCLKKDINKHSYYSFENEILRSLLTCLVIGNLDLCKNKITEYCDLYPLFTCSNIYKFVKNIISSIDASDIDHFKDSINYYQKYMALTDDDLLVFDKIAQFFFI